MLDARCYFPVLYAVPVCSLFVLEQKRAWLTFAASIVLSLFCSMYYFTDKFVVGNFVARHNFLYCTPFFMGGICAYLNRNAIKGFMQRFRWLWLAGCICLTALWYLTPDKILGIDVTMLKNLALFLPWLMHAISVNSRILSNKVMKYLSGISLELYLTQMVIFCAIEKVRGLYLFGHGWVSFMAVWATEIIGLISFIEVWKRVWAAVCRKVYVK